MALAPGTVEGSDVERHVADGRVDADLDELVGRGRDLAGADVAHGALELAAGAGVADAHAAAGLRREACCLGLVEQRRAGARRLASAAREAHAAGDDAVRLHARGRRWRELLDEEARVELVLGPRRAHGLDQSGRTAG